MKNGITMCIFMDIMGILLLFLIITDFGYKNTVKKDLSNKFFDYMVYTNLVLLVTDAIGWFSDGRVLPVYHYVNYYTNLINYAVHPIYGAVWLIYCIEKLCYKSSNMKKHIPYILAPTIIIFILTLFNYKHKGLFFISETNVYHRGEYYVIFSFLIFLYLIYSVFLIIKNLIKEKDDYEYRKNKILLVYSIFPTVGFVLQTLFYGINVVWFLSVVSLLIIYFNFQNVQITTDQLTGINNRRKFETYMNRKIYTQSEDETLFLFMIDIDNFKKINDTFGHLVGDKAIKEASELLIESIEREDFIARLGGDEFVVVGERKSEDEINEAITRIRQVVYESNHKNKRDYTLSFSIGYSCKKYDSEKNIDNMLFEADDLMYKDKKNKRTKTTENTHLSNISKKRSFYTKIN